MKVPLNLTASEMRDIIRGTVTFKKCSDCQGIGREYWIETDGGGQRFISAQEHADFVDNEKECACTGVCDTCDGVGYLVSAWEDSEPQ